MADGRVLVKICGMRDVSSARVATKAGADALGFIRAEARRQVSPVEIRAIVDDLRARFERVPTTVAVFVDAGADDITMDVATSGVDMVQLAGDESPEMVDQLDVAVIKALRFESGMTIDEGRREVERWLDRPRPAKFVLVEGFLPGSHGGTGTLADWTLAAALAAQYPVWLAGGLSPENVGRAIHQVHPAGVDVSSGVERNGTKDPERIRAFFAAVQRSGSSSTGSAAG